MFIYSQVQLHIYIYMPPQKYIFNDFKNKKGKTKTGHVIRPLRILLFAYLNSNNHLYKVGPI